jgi:hypothetical protein
LLVIRPKTLIAEADLPQLCHRPAARECGQQVHITRPHCTIKKDHDEGTNLFVVIEACGVCPPRQ